MPKAFKYGVELETVINYDTRSELQSKLRALPGVELTGDGSIRCDDRNSQGMEIRIGVLGYNALKRLLPRIERICEQYGVTVNQSTGVHVHMSNKRFMTKKYLTRIINLWIAIEDVLISTQPRSRFNNSYCKRSLSDFISKNGNMGIPNTPREIKSWASGLNRYFTLNLSALSLHGTLECRLHAGSTNAKKITNWVTLLTSVYEYALSAEYNPETVKQLFEMASDEAKIAKVFELLKIDTPIATYFNNRISKFLLPELATQQASAVECMKLKPAIDKANKAYTKASEALRRVERQRSNAFSTLGI